MLHKFANRQFKKKLSKKKKKQWRPFPSTQRKTRLDYAEKLKSFAEIQDQFDYRLETVTGELEKANIKLTTIEELCELAKSITGVPAPIETTDKVVAVVEYRDGTVIDVIKQIKR